MLQESTNMLDTFAGNSKLEDSPSSSRGVTIRVGLVQLETRHLFVHILVLSYKLTNSGGTEARRVLKSLVIFVPSSAELWISSYSC